MARCSIGGADRYRLTRVSPRGVASDTTVFDTTYVGHVFRTRYLEDLGIERRFASSLEKQLRALVDEVRDAATSVPTLIDLLSRQHGLHAEGLHRALEKLGLLTPWLEE